jgi:hypothetical protein
MTRDEMIDSLVDDDLNNVEDDSKIDDFYFVETMLRVGFKGYQNFTDAELEEECRERGLYDDGELFEIELEE